MELEGILHMYNVTQIDHHLPWSLIQQAKSEKEGWDYKQLSLFSFFYTCNWIKVEIEQWE